MNRAAMWVLLVVVASAAAVLSFSALRDLAILCGFHERLAWLLPLVVDAGAAAGCLVWLGRHPGAGRRFARTLTWTLLASSVAGNAVVHGLTAYHLAAPWWLVVMVSAIAPAVLGAVVHLAVLISRTEPDDDPAEVDLDEDDPKPGLTLVGEDPVAELIATGASQRQIADTLGVTRHQVRQMLAARNEAKP